MPSAPTKVEHLYVHVPFCVEKCEYCAFYSHPGNADQMTAYVDAVLAELEPFRDQLSPVTIFFGGGTPTLLPVPLLQRLLLPATPAEWTVEANPATVTREKADALRAGGVNRISLGVQSFDDAILRRLGRIHTAPEAVATYELLRTAGFDNLNLDLMFGLPGQTDAQWRDTLQRALDLRPEHISAYSLTQEHDSDFWGGFQPDPDQQLAMYELTMAMLGDAGYRQYEVSNFARPGRECRHNIAYWEGKDYLGLGPSACSTIGPHRWQNVADTGQYIEALLPVGRAVSARRSAVSFEETLTDEVKRGERVAFGLRMNDGVPGALVRGRWDAEIAELIAEELAQWQGDRLRLTRRGLLFADEVAARFV